MDAPPSNETKRYLINGRKGDVAPTLTAGYVKINSFRHVVSEDGHAHPFVLEVVGRTGPGVFG